MRTERRCIQRKRPGGISYFEFESGRGGIVLDASEKGLGFQAADAVHQTGPGRIWISPRPEERIELRGDVVWTDTSGKTGGLRFTETGADSGRKLRNWLGQADEPEASPRTEGFPLPAWATQALGDLRQEDRPGASIPRPAAAPRAKNQQVEERSLEHHPIPSLPSLFTSSSPWQPQDAPHSDSRIGYRIATGFLIVVLGVAGVVLFDMFRPEVGESLIHLGEKINGSTNVQPQNPLPQPRSVQPPAQTLPAADGKPDVAQAEGKLSAAQKDNAGESNKAAEAQARVSSETRERALPNMEAATKEAPNGPPYGRAAAQDRSAEAARLWSAVASGDSSAEVELARLYLRGEGVPRNCVQAKVLLRAAAKGGNFEARQQLKKLRASGCR